MRSVPSRALALVSLALFVVARDALACPTCMSGNDKNVLFLKVGALLSLVPFAVVAVVLWVLRKASREEAISETSARSWGPAAAPAHRASRTS